MSAPSHLTTLMKLQIDFKINYVNSRCADFATKVMQRSLEVQDPRQFAQRPQSVDTDLKCCIKTTKVNGSRAEEVTAPSNQAVKNRYMLK